MVNQTETAPEVVAMLSPLVMTVATLRAQLAAQDSIIEAKESVFYATITADTNHQKELKELLDVAEQRVKAVATGAYNAAVAHVKLYGGDVESVSKQLAPGVGIRVATSWKYKTEDVFEWCRVKGLCIIPEQLDTKAFERMLKSGAVSVPNTEKEETASATIAQDLEKALT